jgi:hypothetical protein
VRRLHDLGAERVGGQGRHHQVAPALTEFLVHGIRYAFPPIRGPETRGMARAQFVMDGRNTRGHGGLLWDRSEHDLDFVFERDGRAYGVEVKNTLAYMDHDELVTKLAMCGALGLIPVFVVRMAPRTWVKEVGDAGGFVLILKYQLYPWSQRDLARRVAAELGLPVDAPRALAAGTIRRFTIWHERALGV